MAASTSVGVGRETKEGTGTISPPTKSGTLVHAEIRDLKKPT